MSQYLIVLLLLTISTFINSLFVYLQSSRGLLSRYLHNFGLFLHALIILPLWISFFVYATYVTTFNSADSYSQLSLIAGIALIVISIVLVVSSIYELGFGSLINSDHFGTTKVKTIVTGVYKYVANPMYLGFDVYILGIGILFLDYRTVIISGLLFLSLNIIQARIEAL